MMRALASAAAGESPIFISTQNATYNFTIIYYKFYANGISLAEFERKRVELEAALGIYIDSFEESADKQYITIRASKVGLPDKIYWHRAYLSSESFVLTLGQGVVRLVRENLNVTPHILIGGSTGSGKSFLQKNLLMQCVQKGAEVYIIDPKGGLDYREKYLNGCTIVVDFEEIKDAARYSGIGEERLRALAQRNPDLVLRIGNHSRIKRNKLEQFVQDSSAV